VHGPNPCTHYRTLPMSKTPLEVPLKTPPKDPLSPPRPSPNLGAYRINFTFGLNNKKIINILNTVTMQCQIKCSIRPRFANGKQIGLTLHSDCTQYKYKCFIIFVHSGLA
jgi:hypothetical protein